MTRMVPVILAVPVASDREVEGYLTEGSDGGLLDDVTTAWDTREKEA